MAGPAGPLAAPGIVLISRLQLRRLRDVPGLLRHSLQLRRGFRAVPGRDLAPACRKPDARDLLDLVVLDR